MSAPRGESAMLEPSPPGSPAGPSSPSIPAPEPVTGDGSPAAGSARGLPVAVIVLTAAVGVALRVVLLVSAIGRPDADEVIAGLMARNLGTDGYPWFFWGQYYGGTVEIAPVALSLRLFGATPLGLRLPAIVLTAGCSVLLWRIATRYLSPRGAQLAGLLAWVGAPPAVWLSTREMLFYGPTVLLGLVAGLFALRIGEGGTRVDRWALGLCLPLGIWTSPNIMYFVVPTVAVLYRDRLAPFVDDPGAAWRVVRDPAGIARRAIPITVAVIAALMAFVMLVKSMSPAGMLPSGGSTAVTAYPIRWWWFFTDGLPGLLGTREMFTYRWLGGTAGMLAYVAMFAVVAWGGGLGLRRLHWDAVGLVAFPFAFATIPRGMDQPNMRYMFFVLPFLVVAVARVAERWSWAPYVALTVAVLVTGFGFTRIHQVSEIDRTVRVGNIGDLEQALAVLDAEEVDAVWANYWIAYRVDFETDQRIIAAPPYDDLRRYPRYNTIVAADDHPAWVVEQNHQRDAVVNGLEQLGVAARIIPAGDFAVIIPGRKVTPAELEPYARNSL